MPTQLLLPFMAATPETNASLPMNPRTYAERVDRSIDAILGHCLVRESAWQRAAELKELRRSGIRS